MTFSNAKAGDRVWSFIDGWGTVLYLDKDADYSVRVSFDEGYVQYFTQSGHLPVSPRQKPVLFWDEVVFEVPKKPLPKLEVDAKVLVWNDDDTDKEPRHFSHFNESGRIVVFADGTTSFSCVIRDKRGQLYDWDNWELVE